MAPRPPFLLLSYAIPSPPDTSLPPSLMSSSPASSDTPLPRQTPGVLLSSSPDVRSQAPYNYALSPEVTKDGKWEKQVLGHGTFESAGGTEMGEDLLPATALSA